MKKRDEEFVVVFGFFLVLKGWEMLLVSATDGEDVPTCFNNTPPPVHGSDCSGKGNQGSSWAS